jgi:hypothetical protein
MNFSARARATEPRAIATRLATLRPNWQHQVTGVALAVGTLMFGYAPLESARTASPDEVHASSAIGTDPGSKSSARDAKRAERAAAREAKKKERASRSSKSDDRSLAKAKSSKSSSGSSVDLGDNDPLEGL